MQTERLRLLEKGPEHWLALLEGEDTFEKRFNLKLAEGIREFFLGEDVSPQFMEKLEAAIEPDPWSFGFAVVQKEENLVIGMVAFKGPPAEAAVEIAYGIAPNYQGKGYATEAAQALCIFAKQSGEVDTVRAHTLRERNASTRVLEKCGFESVGEVIDPDDGPVWRWEKRVED